MPLPLRPVRPVRSRPSIRTLRPAAALAATAALAVAGMPGAAHAATVGVAPARTIYVGSTSLAATTIANDGTIYAADGSDIQVWAPSSDGVPTVVKTFTGAGSSGYGPSLSAAAGLAYVASSSSVAVLDPSQADGAAVPTRTISGAATGLDSPSAVAWTPEGSLWVVDVDTSGSDPILELLRFAPGANGDVAPVQRISGARTKLFATTGIVGVPAAITGLPGNAVAAAVGGFDPKAFVFTSTQTGNVAPSRTLQVPTPSPRWLSAGIASDAQGRIYIGSGDYLADTFGRLDVFAAGARTGAAPVLTLGGTAQRFGIPLLPSVSPNGRISLVDATILALGGGGSFGTIKVFDPLFAKPGKVSGLTVVKRGATATVSWKAAASPSRTPVSYRVVVKKGARTVVSRTVSGLSLALKRSSLPTGALKVTVTGVTAGGSGAAVTKSFRK